MAFETTSVTLETIDLTDHTYRISTLADPEKIDALADSIDQLGLIRPPLILENKPRRRIVSGFQRMAACDRLGLKEVSCRLLLPETPPLRMAQLVVAENAWQRPLNLMEKARCFALLEEKNTESGRLTDLAAGLGLDENPKMIDKLIRLTQLSISIQQAVETGDLGLAMALAVGRLTPEDGGQILDLIQTFRFGLNKQRELIELIQEIAKRESISIGRVLGSADISAILSRTDQDRPARGAALRRYLKQRRYPTLIQAETAFHQLVHELKLGPRIRLNPPPYFEGNTYQLIMAFATLEELHDHQQYLEKMRRHPDLKQFLADKGL
jgi:ParB family chromosome partitioning protein